MTLLFKKADHSEINEALSFFKSASQALKEKKLSQWHYWNDPPKDKIEWVQQGFDNGEFFFVYLENETKIGMFRLLETDPLYWDQKGLEESTRYVHSLVISRKETGKGLGKAILCQLIDQLKKSGIVKFRLDCDASNKRLCQYYEGFGFQKVGEKKTKYATNNLYEMRLTAA